MKKVLVALALVACLTVVGLVGSHHVTKQAGDLTTTTTTITDPGGGGR